MSYFEVMIAPLETILRFERDPESVLRPLGGRIIDLRPGAVFLRQGDLVDFLGCVLEGTVEVEASDWNDRTLLICFSQRGTFFGDLEVFRSTDIATCTLKAVTAVRLWRIDRRRIDSRWQEVPWLLGLVARGLAEKVALRARDAARAQLCSLSERYEDYLGQVGGLVGWVPIALETTASRLGVSSRQLQRVLRDLESQGRLARRGRTVRLVERPTTERR